MEERRKNYEAEEERKRREILAQRKKEIQEATEKFQRSNFVRHRKKIKNTERTPTKTGKTSMLVTFETGILQYNTVNRS